MRFHNELLRRVRVELGLTQDQAALACGVDVRTYRRYESGRVNTPEFAVRHASRRRLLARMAAEFGIDESDLVIASAPDPAARDPQDAPPTWKPRFVHTLQRARHFVGRDDVLAELRRWCREPDPDARVVAIVGLGGAGKTAVAERLASELARETRPAGLWVWSFFENPRTEEFLAQALSYFSPDAERDRDPTLTLDALERALDGDAPHLLVVDGLEFVQSEGSESRAWGELEDPTVRRLLAAIARGLGGTRALVTSRFELADLQQWEGAGVQTIRLSALSESDAVALLSAWGVRGAAPQLAALARDAGGHALSVAMTGSYIGSMLDGDSSRMAEVRLVEAARDDALARRLAAVLGAYAQSLADREHDLLARLSVFGEGVGIDALVAIADAGGDVAGHLAGAHRADLQRDLARLQRLGLVFTTGAGTYSIHPFVRQYFRGRITSADAVRSVVEPAGALTGRPQPAVRDRNSLDTYERVLVQLLDSERTGEAFDVYSRGLGGFVNLGLHLGDMIRGARAVRAFAAGGGPAEVAPGLAPPLRARLLYDWGLFSGALGDIEFARRCYRIYIQIMRDAGDPIALATGWRTLGYTERLAGALESARASATRSIEIAQRVARGGLGMNTLTKSAALLGVICHDLGLGDEADELFAHARRLGDRPVARRALWEAERRLDLGAYDAARSATEANARACEALGWAGHVAHCRAMLGAIAVRTGELDDAADHLTAASQWADATGEVEMVLRCRELRAGLALARGDAADAARQSARGAHLAVVTGAGWFAPRFALLAARAAFEIGDPEPALALIDVSTECAWPRADALHVAGVAASAAGDADRARTILEDALRARTALRHPRATDTSRALAVVDEMT